MRKKRIVLGVIGATLLTGCSIDFNTFPKKLFTGAEIKKDDVQSNAYRNYKIFTGIEIRGRTIDGVLDRLSLFTNDNYVYVSPYHIVFPDNINVKITNLRELKVAIETYTPFTIKVEKRPYNTFAIIAKVKDERKLKVSKTKGPLYSLLREIANVYNANLIIDKDAFSKGELQSNDEYVLNTNTVFDLKEAISAYHNVFINYNPYNKTVKVYKYKYIRKLLPGFNKTELEKYLNGILHYNKELTTPNSFYISKDGMVITKATFSNYFIALKILNTLKELNDKNIRLEFDYLKVKSIDKLPFNLINEKIKSCGNYECVKEVISNYGNIIKWQRNYSTTKINKPGMVIVNGNKEKVGLDYKATINSLKGNNFILNYSLFKDDKNEELIKGTQNAYINTYIPIFIRLKHKDNYYISTYYIIKLSSTIF